MKNKPIHDFNLIYVSTFRDGETIITNSFSLRYKHIEMFWGSTCDIEKSAFYCGCELERLPDATRLDIVKTALVIAQQFDC